MESVVEELHMLSITNLNNKQFQGEFLVMQPQSAVESFLSVREIASKQDPKLPHLR